ncbi:ATP-dependent DNA helicase [Enterococcus camelliae]|uniref:ATP-dependent DNA helicase n=1 Tax=Enterococcus camelliae TaxID=453959 RepID=A0ABW5TLJ0_9ENTE
MHQEKIAVRKLVEFVLKKGSIDNRIVSTHSALEGAAIHRKLQKQAVESDYQKEVSLALDTVVGEDHLLIEGRADGLFRVGEEWTIDEIKTSEVAFEQLSEETLDLFFAQAMVYGYIFGKQKKLAQLSIRLSYYQTTEKKITYQIKQFQMSELTVFFENLLKEYHRWLVFRRNWRLIRNESLKMLVFPHESFRPGQRSFSAVVYKTMKAHRTLFAEAPTGTGKTMATLFPSLKSLGEEDEDHLFYLTAKTITRQVVEDAMHQLTLQNIKSKTVTLTAKEKICFLDKQTCNPIDCRFANGYYNRLNEALWDILHHEDFLSRSVIETYANKHEICPFEFSLDISLWCDVIIGDYNYVFDPNVYLRRFFDEPSEKNLLLIDEAHNLVQRSKDMYTTSITRSSFEEVMTTLLSSQRTLKRATQKILNEFDAIALYGNENGWTEHYQKAKSDTLDRLLLQWTGKVKEQLAITDNQGGNEALLETYFSALRYLKISELYDYHFETAVTIKKVQEVTISLVCLDPAPFLESKMKQAEGTVLFSASFQPLEYYQTVLGGNEQSVRYRIRSPFKTEHQQVLVHGGIETTFRKREQSIHLLVETLFTFIEQRKGNYMVFFSSYAYLQQVQEAFILSYPKIRVLAQNEKMTEQERMQFLAAFQENPQETLLGFCVLGGVFSEGIDLKGTRLIGTAIVGVGLPQINQRQERLRSYFDDLEKNGFNYAYRLPGINKVIQAGGRVIRDEKDYGVILLIDARYLQPAYQQLMPESWYPQIICYQNQTLKERLRNFWGEVDSIL